MRERATGNDPQITEITEINGRETGGTTGNYPQISRITRIFYYNDGELSTDFTDYGD